MKVLYNTLPLPDDRPVTALCVVEDPSKCPLGYTVVAKSHDQDLDADLWKDGFFGKRITRYLCLSKTEGPSGFVIDSLCVINDKDAPPNGYVLLSKTYGAEQRAWRKRQLTYRLSEKNSVFLAITDIIILSKSKKAPEGFTMGGEINGLVLCYKSAPLPSNSNPMLNRVLPSLPAVNLKPTTNSGFTSSTPVVSPTPYTKNSSNANPQIKSPVRPAPLPPLNNDKPSPDDNPATKNHLIVISTSTLSGFTGLEGVPFLKFYMG
ncbi:multivesicular body subunit 12B-like [Daphnia pulex]|uniref:multivesicular body subunit 12B-like n=1 Tax=Daphnia pulex TaxID=6669 RepID=UPI001EDCF213|nr:multivesicular body subunit 12B-like [Daphnia pulex]